MANVGPQAPEAPAPPSPPAPQSPTQQAQHVPHLNWSHFKPEFSGKPEEDAEAYLLRTNDWMDTHQFQAGVKVLSNFSWRNKIMVWISKTHKCRLLQNQFRQQYSKIGNTRQQIFHVWCSFHFDENSETLDTHVTCIRQEAILLGYGEQPILEVFKTHSLQDYIGYCFQ